MKLSELEGMIKNAVKEELRQVVKEEIAKMIKPLVQEAVAGALSRIIAEGIIEGPPKQEYRERGIVSPRIRPNVVSERADPIIRREIANKYFEPIKSGNSAVDNILAEMITEGVTIPSERAVMENPMLSGPSVLDSPMSADMVETFTKDYSALMERVGIK